MTEPLAPCLKAGLTAPLRDRFPTSGVLDSVDRRGEPPTPVAGSGRILVAHQPNLLVSDLVLSTIVDAVTEAAGRDRVIYAAIDYDALDDARLRTAHAPRFDSPDRTISVSLPWRRHVEGTTALAPVFNLWDARKALFDFIETVHAQLRTAGLADDAGARSRKAELREHVAAMPAATYRLMLNALLGYFIDYYGLPVELRSGLDTITRGQTEISALISRGPELTAALGEVRNGLCDAGFHSTLTMSEASLAAWRLDLISGLRSNGAVSPSGGGALLAPRVLLDDLLDHTLHGHSHARAYAGSAEHYFVAEQIAHRLDIAFPYPTFTSRISAPFVASAAPLGDRLQGVNRNKLLAGRFSHLMLYLSAGDEIRERMKSSILMNRLVGQ